jgi:hypothetical protein
MKQAANKSPGQFIVGVAFTSTNVNNSQLSLTYVGAEKAYTPNSIYTLWVLHNTLNVEEQKPNFSTVEIPKP